jgi:hypothetical protein
MAAWFPKVRRGGFFFPSFQFVFQKGGDARISNSIYFDNEDDSLSALKGGYHVTLADGHKYSGTWTMILHYMGDRVTFVDLTADFHAFLGKAQAAKGVKIEL